MLITILLKIHLWVFFVQTTISFIIISSLINIKTFFKKYFMEKSIVLNFKVSEWIIWKSTIRGQKIRYSIHFDVKFIDRKLNTNCGSSGSKQKIVFLFKKIWHFSVCAIKSIYDTLYSNWNSLRAVFEYNYINHFSFWIFKNIYNTQ